MFGFQRRGVRRWEWLTFFPNDGCFPQTSHTADTPHLSPGSKNPPVELARTGKSKGTNEARPSSRWSGRPAVRRCAMDSLGPMATLEALGPADLQAVVASYRDALQAHREAINRLNVYPVP